MNPLRRIQQAKINFIFFQDIITSVMGILILVTLMLSLSIRSGEFGATPDAPFQTQLTEIKNALAQTESENRQAQQEILQAASLPEVAAFQSQATALRQQAARAEEERRRAEAVAARVQGAASEIAGATNLENAVAALEKNLAQLRDRLAATRQQSNSLFIALPQELNHGGRQPVAIIVSKDRLQLRNLTATNAEERALAVAADLNPLLASRNPARDYLVFYFRPSGVKWFESFRDLARSAGFEIGYDAIEEQQEIQFAKP